MRTDDIITLMGFAIGVGVDFEAVDAGYHGNNRQSVYLGAIDDWAIEPDLCLTITYRGETDEVIAVELLWDDGSEDWAQILDLGGK